MSYTVWGWEVPTSFGELQEELDRGIDEASRSLSRQSRAVEEEIQTVSEDLSDIWGSVEETTAESVESVRELFTSDPSQDGHSDTYSSFEDIKKIILDALGNYQLPNPYDILETIFPGSLNSRRNVIDLLARTLGVENIENLSLSELLDAIELKYKSLDKSTLSTQDQNTIDLVVGFYTGLLKGSVEDLSEEDYQEFVRQTMDPNNIPSILGGCVSGIVLGFIWGILMDIAFIIGVILVAIAAGIISGPIVAIVFWLIVGSLVLAFLCASLMVFAISYRLTQYAYDPSILENDIKILEEFLRESFLYLRDELPEDIWNALNSLMISLKAMMKVVQEFVTRPHLIFDLSEEMGHYVGKWSADYMKDFIANPSSFFNLAYNIGWVVGELVWLVASFFIPGLNGLKLLKGIYVSGKFVFVRGGRLIGVATYRVGRPVVIRVSQAGVGLVVKRAVARAQTEVLSMLASPQSTRVVSNAPRLLEGPVNHGGRVTIDLYEDVATNTWRVLDDVAEESVEAGARSTARGTAGREIAEGSVQRASRASETSMPQTQVVSKVDEQVEELLGPVDPPQLPVLWRGAPSEASGIVEQAATRGITVQRQLEATTSPVTTSSGGIRSATEEVTSESITYGLVRGIRESVQGVDSWTQYLARKATMTGLAAGNYKLSKAGNLLHLTVVNGFRRWRRVFPDIKRMTNRRFWGLDNATHLTAAVKRDIRARWVELGVAIKVEGGVITQGLSRVKTDPAIIEAAENLGDGWLMFDSHVGRWFSSDVMQFGHILSAVEFFELTMLRLTRNFDDPLKIIELFRRDAAAFMTNPNHYLPQHKIINEGLGRFLGRSHRYRFNPDIAYTNDDLMRMTTDEAGRIITDLPLNSTDEEIELYFELIQRVLDTIAD